MYQKRRNAYLLRTYGIDLGRYNEILEKQGGGCKICAKTPEEEGKALAVDHDHKTGEVRGILCSYCNKYGVGRFRDPDYVQRIADYLRGPFPGEIAPKKKKKRKRNVKSTSRNTRSTRNTRGTQ